MAGEVDTALARVLDGDLSAYESVVEKYQGAVWSVISVLLYDRAESERLLREVFIQVYDCLHRFDPDRHNFQDFVKTIARFRVRRELDAALARSGRLEAYRSDLRQQFGSDAAAAEYQHRLVDDFRRCTARVPDHVKMIIQMRYHDMRGWEQIGKATNRPVSTVRQQLRQTIGEIARCMHQRSAEA
jgi:RNA polymerase sigma-70 factor (ECF subfamily)